MQWHFTCNTSITAGSTKLKNKNLYFKDIATRRLFPATQAGRSIFQAGFPNQNKNAPSKVFDYKMSGLAPLAPSKVRRMRSQAQSPETELWAIFKNQRNA